MTNCIKSMFRKVRSFFGRKSVRTQVAELENTVARMEKLVAQLEKQNRELKRAQKKAGEQIAQATQAATDAANAAKKAVGETKPKKAAAKAKTAKPAAEVKAVKPAAEAKAKKPVEEAKAKKPAKDTHGKSPEYLAEVEGYVQKIMHKAGLEHDIVETGFWDTRKRTGCMPKEYYLYGMYDMTEEQQKATLVASIQKSLQTKYDVNKDFVSMLRDKERTNIFFAKYIRRPWCVNTKVTFEQFREKFANTPRVIYKPLSGNRGRGVEAFNLDAGSMREVYDILSEYPSGVVEQYVVQHPDMLKLCPSSVNTVRIVTFSSNSVPVTDDGKYMDIAYASLRIGGGNSVVDNFHSGGMCCHIDMQTGKLITDAADMNCNVFTHHPTTGVQFMDFQIPCFKEAIAMVTEAITENKLEGYLGWDVAIAEDGPILIEVNTQPGVVLLSTPYAAKKIGMRHVLAKYL